MAFLIGLASGIVSALFCYTALSLPDGNIFIILFFILLVLPGVTFGTFTGLYLRKKYNLPKSALVDWVAKNTYAWVISCATGSLVFFFPLVGIAMASLVGTFLLILTTEKFVTKGKIVRPYDYVALLSGIIIAAVLQYMFYVFVISTGNKGPGSGISTSIGIIVWQTSMWAVVHMGIRKSIGAYNFDLKMVPDAKPQKEVSTAIVDRILDAISLIFYNNR